MHHSAFNPAIYFNSHPAASTVAPHFPASPGISIIRDWKWDRTYSNARNFAIVRIYSSSCKQPPTTQLLLIYRPLSVMRDRQWDHTHLNLPQFMVTATNYYYLLILISTSCENLRWPSILDFDSSIELTKYFFLLD